MNICRQIAARLMAPGKGILAADESITTMSARLRDAGVEPSADSRRAYREMLVGTPGLAEAISGVIFCDETLAQRVDGASFAEATSALGMLAGVKVDTGARPCPGLPGEKVTEGLDGLLGRLVRYAEMGAAFAKWRAVFEIGEHTPSASAIGANASALARYAAACQKAGLVPIVEPEVLMSGNHNLGRCAHITAEVQYALRNQLAAFHVDLAGMVLKPNMVIEGEEHPQRATPEHVAEATVRMLRAWPDDLAGVAFLSGGQEPQRATANLAAMQCHPTAWPLTFSFGRALVSPALAAWRGDPGRVIAGQAALADRVAANAAAAGMRAVPQPA
jgi:fructose-bisphosphate aldolase, class I